MCTASAFMRVVGVQTCRSAARTWSLNALARCDVHCLASTESFLKQRVDNLQRALAAAGAPSAPRPVVLIENSSKCNTNSGGEKVLPSGDVWLAELFHQVSRKVWCCGRTLALPPGPSCPCDGLALPQGDVLPSGVSRSVANTLRCCSEAETVAPSSRPPAPCTGVYRKHTRDTLRLPSRRSQSRRWRPSGDSGQTPRQQQQNQIPTGAGSGGSPSSSSHRSR